MKYLSFCLLLITLVNASRLESQEVVIHLSDTFVDGQTAPFNNMIPGDTIWIQAGNRNNLRLQNFHGTATSPVIFANLRGQVIVETDQSYGISFAACSHFKLIGLPGDGFSYGIKIARVNNSSGMGISAGYKSTDMEIRNCEITNIGFAGIMVKTDALCGDPTTWREGFTQYNTIIHDCYVHDVTGEGFYIGDTHYDGFYPGNCAFTVLPAVLIGTRIYNNRIERTGYDGIQVSSAVRDCEIHHNVLIDCGYRMVQDQRSGIIIGGGTQAKCYNNKIIDCYATGILVFGKGGTEVFNNLIVRPGKRFVPNDPLQQEHGIFLSDKSGDTKTFYGIYNNTIIQPKSDGIRIDNTVNFEVRIFNNAIIDPGSYQVYENDNTERVGQDSYIFDTGNFKLYSASNNYLSTNLFMSGFVNVSVDDYHPQSGSPLIDGGMDLTYFGVIMDLDDHPRPIGAKFDIGSYEYSENLAVSQNSVIPGCVVNSVGMIAGNLLRINLDASRNIRAGIRLTDILGRVVYKRSNMEIVTGNSDLYIPVSSPGMLILIIESERLSYARKILVF